LASQISMNTLAVHPRKVAVLGAAGNIGRAACAGLVAHGHMVRGIDVVNTPPKGVTDYRIVDVTDGSALREALEGMEVAIHLAGVLVEGSPRRILLGPSFLGVWNIYEAAAAGGIERLIVTSTNQVVENPEAQDCIVTVDASYTPDHVYAVSKIFLEVLAHMYAKKHRMSILIVRPGWMPRSREEMALIGETLRRRNMYLSFNDAARFFCCAVETDRLPTVGVEVVYAQSKGEKLDGGLDREPARRLLRYEGIDVWPNGYPDLA